MMNGSATGGERGAHAKIISDVWTIISDVLPIITHDQWSLLMPFITYLKQNYVFTEDLQVINMTYLFMYNKYIEVYILFTDVEMKKNDLILLN